MVLMGKLKAKVSLEVICKLRDIKQKQKQNLFSLGVVTKQFPN